MAVTTDTILNALKAGTYTLETLTTDKFFKTQQPEKRRRFPSVELLEVKPQSSVDTDEKRDFTRQFDVKIFLRFIGGQAGGQSNEIDSLETLETELLTVIESTTLGEHKLVTESKEWNREYKNNAIPPHIISTLRIVLRQVTPISETPDGVLIFRLSGSIGDSLPASDYIYTQAFNSDVDEGYNHIEEYSNRDANPKNYTGGFRGSFITHIKVKSADFGSTTDKLNQISRPQVNGQLPTVVFRYTNKTGQTPTPNTLQKDLILSVTNITELYRTQDNVVFRLLCRLLQPSTTTVI